jgi:hypothetical protein
MTRRSVERRWQSPRRAIYPRSGFEVQPSVIRGSVTAHRYIREPFGGGSVMEHRWGQRHAFEQMVLLRAAGWRVLARVRDISISGAYFRCVVPDAGVARVRVDFRQPRSPELVAYIVRRTPEGIGVEWGEFGCRAITRLLSRVPPDGAEACAPSPECSNAAATPRGNGGRRHRRHGLQGSRIG